MSLPTSSVNEDWTLLEFFSFLSSTTALHETASKEKKKNSSPVLPFQHPCEPRWKCVEVMEERVNSLGVRCSTPSQKEEERIWHQSSTRTSTCDGSHSSSSSSSSDVDQERGGERSGRRPTPPVLHKKRIKSSRTYKLSTLEGLEMAAFHVSPVVVKHTSPDTQPSAPLPLPLSSHPHSYHNRSRSSSPHNRNDRGHLSHPSGGLDAGREGSCPTFLLPSSPSSLPSSSSSFVSSDPARRNVLSNREGGRGGEKADDSRGSVAGGSRFVEVWVHGGRRRLPFSGSRSSGSILGRGRGSMGSAQEKGNGEDLSSVTLGLFRVSTPRLEVSSTLLRIRIPTAFPNVDNDDEEDNAEVEGEEDEGAIRYSSSSFSSSSTLEYSERREEKEGSGGRNKTSSPLAVLQGEKKKKEEKKRSGEEERAEDSGDIIKDNVVTCTTLYPPPPPPPLTFSSTISEGHTGEGKVFIPATYSSPIRPATATPIPTATAVAGPALYDHAMFQHGPLILLHGGRDGAGVVQSALHAYHIQRHCWISPTPEQFGGVCPPRMCGHGVCALHHQVRLQHQQQQCKGSTFVVVGMVYNALGYPVGSGAATTSPSLWFSQQNDVDFTSQFGCGSGGGGGKAAGRRNPGERMASCASFVGKHGQGHRGGAKELSVFLLDLSAKNWSEIPLAYREDEDKEGEEEEELGMERSEERSRKRKRGGTGQHGGHHHPPPTPGIRSHFSLSIPGNLLVDEAPSQLKGVRPPPLLASAGAFPYTTTKMEEDGEGGAGLEEDGDEAGQHTSGRQSRQLFLVGGDRGGIPLFDAWVLDLHSGIWRSIDLYAPLYSFLHPSLRAFVPFYGMKQGHPGHHRHHDRVEKSKHGMDPNTNRKGEANDVGREMKLWGDKEEGRVEWEWKSGCVGGKSPRERRRDRSCPFRLYPIHLVRGNRRGGADVGEVNDSPRPPPPSQDKEDPQEVLSSSSSSLSMTATTAQMAGGGVVGSGGRPPFPRTTVDLEVIVFSCLQSPHFRLLSSQAQKPYRTMMPIIRISRRDLSRSFLPSPSSSQIEWGTHVNCAGVGPLDSTNTVGSARIGVGAPCLPAGVPPFPFSLPGPGSPISIWSSASSADFSVPHHFLTHLCSSSSSSFPSQKNGCLPLGNAHTSSFGDLASPLFPPVNVDHVPCLHSSGIFPWLFLCDEEQGVYVTIARNGSVYALLPLL